MCHRTGVQRFVPSEFGCDLNNANNKTLLPYVPKIKFEEYLAEKAKTSSLTYTLVYNGALLDWGITHNFLLDTSSYEPKIFNDGDRLFNTTSLETVGDAVRGVLASPEKTENRAVYVSDMRITQNELLAMAKKAAPEKPWQPKYVSLDETVAAADKRLEQGIVDLETIIPYLFKGIFHPNHGGDYEKNDNEILGVVPKTRDFAEKVFVEHLSQRE